MVSVCRMTTALVEGSGNCCFWSYSLRTGGGVAERVGFEPTRLAPTSFPVTRPRPTRRPLRGGGGGIRTHERLAPLAVFETAALGRYATPPWGDYTGEMATSQADRHGRMRADC